MFSSKQTHMFNYFICYHLESGCHVTRPNQGFSLGRGKSLGPRLVNHDKTKYTNTITSKRSKHLCKMRSDLLLPFLFHCFLFHHSATFRFPVCSGS